MWVPRREQDLLRTALETHGPGLATVLGRSGSGRSALVRRALPKGRRVLWHEAVDVGAARQLEHLRASWELGPDPVPMNLAGERVPTILVLDGTEHVSDPSGIAGVLGDLWTAARGQALPLQLVLVGSSESVGALMQPASPLTEAATLHIDLAPLAPHEIAEALGGWSASDRLKAWAVFGGRPTRLRHLDPTVKLSTNVQHIVVDPAGPLHRDAPETLARTFQKPGRYAGLILALARGARDWSGLREAVPEFGASSQLAPYIASLLDQDLVRSERPLDARPGSRSRRYRVADPFLGFWYRCILPRLGELAHRDPRSVWREALRAEVRDWATVTFPFACRSLLVERGERVLPARAREVGGLWGEGWEIPVAATLRNGAVVHGTAVRGRTATLADAEALGEAVRETRYGFGREARLRVVFTADGADHDLERAAARDPLLEVVRWEDMIGA